MEKNNLKKSVTFILPSNLDKPIGGYKIIYQYANFLSAKGYNVNLVFLYKLKFPGSILDVMDRFLHKLLKRYYKWDISWFSFKKNINIIYYPLKKIELPDSDIVVASAARTVPLVNSLSDSKGKKFYFIQNYEAEEFGNTQKYLHSTYNFNMGNIVISKDLEKKVLDSGAKKPFYLPNFYDSSEFFCTNSIEKRQNIVSLLYHEAPSKRSKLGLEILKEVKKVIPDLKVELFGATEPNFDLDEFVNFTLKADAEQLREEIYGKSKIYLMPSILEGWGLTGLESMACGAALIASNIGGITEYADNKNSILVEADNKALFIKNIIKLLSQDSERIRYAEQGLRDASEFTLEKSGKKLLDILA
ncbi:glycosyltransferase family 4 protein [Lactococcus cremoris]|uniref:glycosyltransferase family 4 protein n=1 Tax=Lactococcus lactis subsp. cremoris TaxID=1359 RepID=UPI002FC9EE78